MNNLKSWGWLVASVLSSFLFYRQSAGINFLLFSVGLVTIMLALYPALRQSSAGKALSLGSLLAAGGVVLNHTWLAVVLHVGSCIALVGLATYPRTSFAVALPNGIYTSLLSFWQGSWFIFRSEEDGQRRVRASRTLTWIIPFLVTGVFLLLYISANPAFAALVHQTGADIISPGRLIFTLAWAYFFLAVFYPIGLKPLIRADQRISDAIVRRRRSTTAFGITALKQEYRSGWLLLALLNGLLLLFNSLDMYHLTTGRLPDGVTYSAYVHQGILALIVSIVLAITVVAYYFRGNLNFYRQAPALRRAAYAWIGQNIIVVMATAYKNYLYIDAYGLTQKRLGVYVYLLLALAGLLTTFVKVRQLRSTAFLIRYNSWVFYAVVAGMTLFNWPRIITRYNLHQLSPEQVDLRYLSDLSTNNLDLVQDVLKDPAYRVAENTRKRIRKRIARFRDEQAGRSWRSWNYADARVLHRLADK